MADMNFKSKADMNFKSKADMNLKSMADKSFIANTILKVNFMQIEFKLKIIKKLKVNMTQRTNKYFNILFFEYCFYINTLTLHSYLQLNITNYFQIL
jgi:hypothetical protein